MSPRAGGGARTTAGPRCVEARSGGPLIDRGMARVLSSLLVLTVLTGLTACQGDDKPDDSGAVRAAAVLAAAFEQDDLTDPWFSDGQPQNEYDAVVAGLDGLKPRVDVEQVRVNDAGTIARVSLAWTWPVGEQEWSYTSQARMTRNGDNPWITTWTRAIIQPDLGSREVLDRVGVTPRRGTIIGAGGRAIVLPRAVERIGLDKTKVAGFQALESARALA